MESDTVTAISVPRTSTRDPNYLWVYIDEVAANGQAKGVSVPRGIKIAKGDTIPRNRITFNEQLQSSVFLGPDDVETEEDPELDPEPPARWDLADHTHTVKVNPRPGAYGQRGPAYRKAQVRAAATPVPTMPADLSELLELTAKSYLYMSKRVGVQEPPRGEIAKSLVITVLIQYMKAHGITPPSDDDELSA